MKNSLKKLLCTSCAATMLLSGSSALAANAPNHADYWLGGRVYVEGNSAQTWNENQEGSYYLSYNGSIYVRLNTVAEWMGKNVVWNEAGKTISFEGDTASVYRGNAAANEFASLGDDILDNGTAVTIRNDVRVLKDGQPVSLTGANGSALYPIESSGAIYLPVRVVSEMLGMSINYNAEKRSVYMRTPLTDAQTAECAAYINTLLGQQNVIYRYSLMVTPPGRNPTVSEADKIEIKTMDDLRSALTACKGILDVVMNTPKPDQKLLDGYYAVMMQRADAAMEAYQKIVQMVDSGESFSKCYEAFAVECSTGEAASFNAKSLVDRIEFMLNGGELMYHVLYEDI